MEIFPLRKSGLESGLKSGLTESGVLPPGSSAALVFTGLFYGFLQALFTAFYRPFLWFFTGLIYGFLQAFFMAFTSPFL